MPSSTIYPSDRSYPPRRAYRRAFRASMQQAAEEFREVAGAMSSYNSEMEKLITRVFWEDAIRSARTEGRRAASGNGQRGNVVLMTSARFGIAPSPLKRGDKVTVSSLHETYPDRSGEIVGMDPVRPEKPWLVQLDDVTPTKRVWLSEEDLGVT